MNGRRPGHREHNRIGLVFGLAAYLLWGVLPIYFKLIEAQPPLDIVAHRVVWSLPLLGLLVTASRGWDSARQAIVHRRTIGMLVLTSALIAANWLLYIEAVTHGHILAASFGYYLNPLANVLLGRFVLNERLDRRQWIAVVIAASGISVLAIGALNQLWISLALCATFASYGLLRKIVAADAVTGLAIETAILFPVAFLWFAWRHSQGGAIMGSSQTLTVLLLIAGLVSTTPLLLFTAAAKRLQYSTLGMLQFIAPTFQFLIAVLMYGEPFTKLHAIAFAAIWTALALYVTALLRSPSLPQPPE